MSEYKGDNCSHCGINYYRPNVHMNYLTTVSTQHALIGVDAHNAECIAAVRCCYADQEVSTYLLQSTLWKLFRIILRHNGYSMGKKQNHKKRHLAVMLTIVLTVQSPRISPS